MFKLLASLVVLILFSFSVSALPDDVDFVIAPDFPQPAPGSFTVVGTAQADGRYLLWDGKKLIRQRTPGGDELNVIANGYMGDPAFLAISPSGNTAP